MVINTDSETHFSQINSQVRNTLEKEIEINGCIGQRYIGTGLSGKRVKINGIPGNALGAYLNGGEITVYGNAQDATGDTMNSGTIIIHGNAGDTTGYAMRGGKIYIRGNSGYRTGIHMKEYGEHKPVIVIGGRVGSFLGEYQAGGVIVVLGQHEDDMPIINNFCGTGMHGGVIYIRCKKLPKSIPGQVSATVVKGNEVKELSDIVRDYCTYFNYDAEELLNTDFTVLKPNSSNPYKQMYTAN
ncbi:MAG: glutamate synthase [Candidatus Coproplasma sp.]